MRKRYRMVSESEEESEERPWLMTYADMVTLLLTFFVLLLTFASFESDKLMKALDSIKEALGLGVLPAWNKPIDIESKPPVSPEFDALIKAMEKIKGVSVTKTERGVKVHVENLIFFDSGKADLKGEAKEILDKIADTLKGSIQDVEINISGHTDNQPIHTPEFPSNWELSTDRATNVLKYLVEKGLPAEKLSASGYAEFKPISSNDTEEGRSKNRRMEILISKKIY